MKSIERLARMKMKIPTGVSDVAARVAAVLGGGRKRRDRSRDNTWLMIVRESDLLFASWPVPPDEIRPIIPPMLDVDTFDGNAWVTIETLRLDTVRFRHLPPLPKPLQGVEVNLRTYVRFGETRGVYFMSLDCPGAIGNALNRTVFNLPFRTAEVRLTVNGDNYHVESLRLERAGPAVRFAASARIIGNPKLVDPGSIDEFLLTQTTLFGIDGRGRLFRGDVAHRPRLIQPVDGTIETDSLTAAVGVTLPKSPPLLHYSPGDDSLAWPFTRVAQPSSRATESPVKRSRGVRRGVPEI
jgi:uncharacterized protein YqjF (DUF2071 family)